jgi:hypothetical protein
MFFPIGYRFAHSINHITSFTDSYTYLSTLITDHDNSSEAQLFTTFNYFANAANLDNTFLPSSIFFLFTFFFVCLCVLVLLP